MGQKLSPDERVAKITARQAIIVALITASAGIAGALIQKFSAMPQQFPRQHWLVISGVDAPGQQPGTKVRVVADVDGVHLSYPGRAVWSELGTNMSSQALPIPVGASKHKVSFSMFLGDASCRIRQATSQEVVIVAQVPFKSEYRLAAFDEGTRAGNSSSFRIAFDRHSA